MTRTVLQRVVLPPRDRDELLPLVVRGIQPDAPRTESGIEIPPGATASFGTYFAGFPGAWWRAAGGLASVALELAVRGEVVVRVHRSDAAGRSEVVLERSVVDGPFVADVDLPAADGGWLWCEASAGDDGATVAEMRWTTDAAPRRPGTVTVAITTFDRETDCVGVLTALAAETDAGAVARIVVADQGTRRLRAAAGFAGVADLLGDRLRVIEQPNLGGSGGFSRGMLAAVAEGSEHVLLLDDDIRLEPESLRRLLAFASYAVGPTLVGAHMLSLVDPTVLHSFGERVDRRLWLWRPAVPDLAEVDLRTVPLEESGLHRRVDVDFNGWWMCLVPTSVVRDAGAALPLFIKWDDTEFALRAAAVGVPTVTLPGAAVWHMPWTAKDDGLDWQAYFQLRNRLVTALLHGRRRRETGVLAASLAQDVNHVLCLQYGSAAVRRAALRDVLSGPGHLAPSALSARRRAQRILEAAGQTVVVPDAARAPRRPHLRPRGAPAQALRLCRVLLHQLAAPRPGAEPVGLARADGKWWSVGLEDAAAVESATGRGAFVGRRSRTTALALVRDAVALRAFLWWRWPRLAARYRAAASDLSGAATWESLVAGAVAEATPSVD